MPKKPEPYPSDVSDEEWAFCAPYLTLMKEDAPQREHDLRAVFNALRYLVRAGCPWRLMPHDLSPWRVVYEQTQRWNQAGCLEAMAHDLRVLLRVLADRQGQPTAVILDSRTLQSPRRAARVPATMATSAARVQKSTPQWTPWAICWHSKPRRPTNKIARKSEPWPSACRKSPGRA